MSIEQIFDVSQFGLAYERLRLEAAAHNIAIANTPLTEGSTLKPVRITASSAFETALGNADTVTVQETETFRLTNDPRNPLADTNGNVRYPDVNVVDEMTTLISASRAYEANVRAMNTLREMLLKALEIGRQ